MSAQELHRRAVVVDLHLDSLLWARLVGYDIRRRHRNFLPRSPLGYHADLPRMLEGGLSAAFFGLHAWPFTGEAAFWEVVRQIELFHSVAARDPRLVFGSSPDVIRASAAAGRIVGCFGLEGAHSLNGRLERVELLHQAGVRYITLAHFSKNRAATPALGAGASGQGGLSGFGRELVHEMNRVGVIVDCAHLNEPCRLEAAGLSTRPVIVSHTGVNAVVSHKRNISDDSIRAVAATDGVIGVMFAPVFMSGGLNGSVRDIVEHVRHIVSLVGIGHVAIGTDFDGFIPSVPKETPDISHLPRFTLALVDAGFSSDEIEAILGGNVLRVLEGFHDDDSESTGTGPIPGKERIVS